ncbi:hypothetical protein [Winogradskyella vincentii]|uniref:DUF5689 domain-containing protein n=1 Tax=Winogradskyella vincentii TaxID=2877122 RepID=A0ABS7XXU6_9FLAO|nr:hypothetical protein [Winogradskyella vincentii]MCA0151859.1 hypothetical protein [Winogradskyella vincentii]
MKTFIRITMALLLMISFTSCDELDELTEVDFDTTLNENLNVSVPVGDNLALNETMVVNMINDDTEDYMDLLESVRITSFTYQLINFTGDAEGTIVGTFEADGVTLLNHDMVVKDEVDAGTVFEVTDVSLLNSIASKLKNGNNVFIGIAGNSTCEEEMNFTIAMTIMLDITADAL